MRGSVKDVKDSKLAGSRKTEYAWDTIANEEVHVGYIEDWPNEANRKQDWRAVIPLREGAEKAEHGDGSARYRCCDNRRCASAVYVVQAGINKWHFRRNNGNPRKPPVCKRRDHYVGESSYHWKTTLQIKKFLEHKMRTKTEWLGQTIMKVEREVLRHFATGDAGIQLKPDVYVRFDNGDWLVVEVVYTHAPDQKNAVAYDHLKSSSNQFGPRIIELNLEQSIDGDITDKTYAEWVQQGGMEKALDFEAQLEHREERFVNRKMKFDEKARLERIRGIEKILSSLRKDFPHLDRLDVELDEGQELQSIEDAFIQVHRDFLEIKPIVETWEQTFPCFVLPTEYRESPVSTDFSKRFWEIVDTAKKGTEYLNGKWKSMENEGVSPEMVIQVKQHGFNPQDYPDIEEYKRYLDGFCDSLVEKYREEEAYERLEELKQETQIDSPIYVGGRRLRRIEPLVAWYTRAKQVQRAALRIVEEKIESHKLNEFQHVNTSDVLTVYVRALVIPEYTDFNETEYAARVDKKFRELVIEDQIRISSSHDIKMPTFHRGEAKIETREDVIEWYEMAVEHKLNCEKGRSNFTEGIAEKFGERSAHYQEISVIPIDYRNLEEDTNHGEVAKTYTRLIQLKSDIQLRRQQALDRQLRRQQALDRLESHKRQRDGHGRSKKDELFNPFAHDASAQRNKRMSERSQAQRRNAPVPKQEMSAPKVSREDRMAELRRKSEESRKNAKAQRVAQQERKKNKKDYKSKEWYETKKETLTEKTKDSSLHEGGRKDARRDLARHIKHNGKKFGDEGAE